MSEYQQFSDFHLFFASKQMKYLPSKSTLAADSIREISKMISEGVYKPGDSLPPQKEMAGQLGVGVSTIREAFQALTAMGVVESRAGKGTWVRSPSTDTLRGSVVRATLGDLKAEQLYEARWTVEVSLTEYAARRATPEDIAPIWQALQDMQSAFDLEDVEAYADADLRFHIAVAHAAGNQLLEEFYNLIHELLAEAMRAMDQIPEVRLNGVPMQTRIARAIEKHDPSEARLAAVDLLVYVAQFFYHSQPVEPPDTEK